MKNWRRRVLAQPIKAMLRMCWRVYSVNKANNALYVDCQNLPASFVQTDWPALLGLFIGQYLLCYLVLRLLRESALVSQLSDFIYYCSVVGSTLGFGDLSPQTAPDVCSPRCGKFRLASGCSAR